MTRIRQEWTRWGFSPAGGAPFIQDGGPWRYRCLPSDRFYEEALGWLRGSKSIELRTGTPVLSAHTENGVHSVETGSGHLEAGMVVDTRPPGKSSQPLLRQQFIGVELEGEGIAKDPETVGLMENMRADEDGFLFHYRLPFGRDRCLLEVTRFTPRPLPWDRMENDLAAALRCPSLAGAATSRREEGMIPMGLPPEKPPAGPNWVTAGTRGGAVRPATGYAFQRIEEWAKSCARALVERGHPIPQKPFSRSLGWMDRLFLRVLRDKPELAPLLFMRFARRLTPGQSVRFLSNQPKLSDQWHVIRSFPARPFLQQLRRSV